MVIFSGDFIPNIVIFVTGAESDTLDTNDAKRISGKLLSAKTTLSALVTKITILGMKSSQKVNYHYFS